MSSLVYYVSGHGFGHAVRSGEIIRALRRARPALAVHVRSGAPDWLFPGASSIERVELDVGVVQPDALRIDRAATLRLAASLASRADSLVGHEREIVRGLQARLVVSDIPALAFLIAQACRVPGIGVANFAWDWIYEPYIGAEPHATWLLDWLRQAYASADLLLRLPFHGDLSAFRNVEDVPLVTRKPTAPRQVLRQRLGLQEHEQAVLLSFGGLGLSGLDARQLEKLGRYTFLGTEKELQTGNGLPANVRLLPIQSEHYDDLIGASDVVVSKPGFGIVASCLAQRIPLLYTSREDFREYPILVQAIHTHGRGLLIPQEDLLAGNLGPFLKQLLGDDAPWSPLRTDGATVIAERLLKLLGPSRA
jgi:L-arabinokinase